MKLGISNEKKIIVTGSLTAKAMGSGDLEVFATPAMIALMEGCAAESVSDYLDEGETTVGVSIQVKHLAATPIAMQVICESVLKEMDGRRLCFELKVQDESGLIGTGVHERYIVNSDRFLEKTYQKLEK